jgi:uncharacterized protein (TIGR02246 family)
MVRQVLIAVFAGAALVVPVAAHAKAHPASPKSDIENDAAIRKLYAEFQAAWNRHDVPAMASMWVEDGDHVEPDGRVAKSRTDIEKLLTRQHMSVFQKSELTLTVDQIWFVTSDVALVDGRYELTDVYDPDGNLIPPRAGKLTSVLLHESGKWWVAADRLMIPAPLPWRKD